PARCPPRRRRLPRRGPPSHEAPRGPPTTTSRPGSRRPRSRPALYIPLVLLHGHSTLLAPWVVPIRRACLPRDHGDIVPTLPLTAPTQFPVGFRQVRTDLQRAEEERLGVAMHLALSVHHPEIQVGVHRGR